MRLFSKLPCTTTSAGDLCRAGAPAGSPGRTPAKHRLLSAGSVDDHPEPSHAATASGQSGRQRLTFNNDNSRERERERSEERRVGNEGKWGRRGEERGERGEIVRGE